MHKQGHELNQRLQTSTFSAALTVPAKMEKVIILDSVEERFVP
jgi:hypothetical protein